MAKDQTKRLSPAQRQADLDALAAIEDMTDYAPSNQAYAKSGMIAQRRAMQDQQAVEKQKEIDLGSARDDSTALEWEFHNGVKGGKTQVVAQYGDDSNQAQAVGLTKSSERAKPGPRKPKP